MKSSRPRKQFLFVLACYALVAGVVAVTMVVAFRQQGEPLLQRAKRAAAPPSGGGYARSRSSLSDREWIVDNAQGNHSLGLLEINTGQWTALPGLTRLFNRHPVGMRDPDVSPDGRSVLWTAYPRQFDHALRIAAAVDGSRHITWPAAVADGFSGVPCYVAWLPDSRHIAEIVAEAKVVGSAQLQVTIHDIDSGRSSKVTFPVPVSPDLHCQVVVRQGNLLMTTDSVDEPGRLPQPENVMVTEVSDLSPPRPTSVDLYVWSLAKPGGQPRKLHLKAPEGSRIAELAVSPAGDRLAWEVVRTHVASRFEALLSRLLRRSVPAPQEREEVWTSRIDGGDMREIGYMPPQEWFGYLEWLPGGKRLRFPAAGDLGAGSFTVPVD